MTTVPGPGGAVLLDSGRRVQKEAIEAKERARQQVPAAIDPSNRKAWYKLEGLQRQNGEMLEELGKLGVLLNPMELMKAKFECLIDVLFPGDTKEGQAKIILLETLFEERVNTQLTSASKQALQLILDQGKQVPPEQWNALAAAAGMAGLSPSTKKV